MAIVPMFQGGLTQERDIGRDHAGEIRLARPTFDYEKNMAKALQPIDEAGKSITKALEIEANRNVKAEADEAEQKYLDIERRILYGPQQSESSAGSADSGFYRDGQNANGVASVPLPQREGQDIGDDGFYRDIPNGYFGQNGRNAVDTYDKSIEGLKKEAQSILDNLSPWARESLQSRIADRLNSAETRMLQWRNNQEQRWHLESSRSRIDSLIRSAGDNPNNPEYLAKTQASIDAEVEYIGRLQGLDDQQISELRNKYRDLTQASRFTSWAQDNPIGALEAFQREREGISRDVAQKLSDELFRTAKPQLGMLLSQQYGSKILDEKDFLREAVTKGKKTGIPAIDNLSAVQKASLWSSAHAFVSQQRAVAKSSIAQQTNNALSEASMNGSATNVPDKEAFIDAFGKDEGEKKYEGFLSQLETTTSIHNYAGMTDAEIRADVEAAKPVPGSSDFADQKKLYDARQKAATEITKARREDSVAFASAGGQFGFEPLDFSNTEKLVAQLQNRVEKASEVSKAWGAKQRLFSKGELDGLVSVLDSAPINQRVGLLTTIANAIGSEGLRIVSDQMTKTSEIYAIAMAGMDMSPGETTPGEMYLRGLDAISTGRVKIDTAKASGTDASIANAIGEEPATDSKDSIRGVFDSPEAEEMSRKLAKGVWAYKSLAGNDDTEGAVNTALGGEVFTYNRRKIVLPRGVEGSTLFGDDFLSLLNKEAYRIRTRGTTYTWAGKPLSRDQMANALQYYDLKTEKVNPDGSVLYSVQSSGIPVFTDKGALLTFTLSAPSKEEK